MLGESKTRMHDKIPWNYRTRYALRKMPIASALSSPYAETIIPRNSLRFRVAAFFRSLGTLLNTPLW